MNDFAIFAFKILVVVGAIFLLKVPFNIALFVLIVFIVIQIPEKFGLPRKR
jgi:hypothetical protein